MANDREMPHTAAPAPADSPLMLAWKAYQTTDEFKNSLHWAMTIAPMLQAGDPEAERKRYSLMPVEQSEQHVMGSLWAAFCAGRKSVTDAWWNTSESPPYDPSRDPTKMGGNGGY